MSAASLALLVALIATGPQEPGGGARTGAPTTPNDTEAPWEHAHAWLAERHERLAADLETAREELAANARANAPRLAARFEEAPAPRVRASGWGVLPPWRDDPAPRPFRRRERRYSLEEITTAYAADVRDAALLAARAAELGPEELRRAADELDRLRRRADNLSEHLSYHAFWQAAVADEPEVFAAREELARHVRRWVALERSDEDPDEARRLRSGLRPELAPFRPSPAVRLAAVEGGRVLRVCLATDVEDEAFLERALRAVDDVWNGSAAFGAHDLALEIELVRTPVRTLYADPPGRGDEVDLAAHVARFPEDCAVLTSGAASTHARAGRAVVLGPEPLAPRTFAHEFGHLLGFTDAYLRASEGDPADPFGVVLVEWRGLFDDLMGRPGAGEVGEAMVAELLEAYD